MSQRTHHAAWRLAATLVAGAVLTACADRASTGPATSGPGFAIVPPTYPTPPGHTPRFPDPEHVEVCKIGSSADFYAEHFESSVGATQSTTFTLTDGGCRIVAALEGPDGNFYVEETALPLGYELDSVLVIHNVGGALDTTKTTADNVTILNADNTSGGWLVEFFNSEIETPGEGCTLTQGYWKTHSEHGPAFYDAVWGQLSSEGADTPFYSSGKTWHQVFWTPPAGNAYYNLAHQYMAAYLNTLGGASTTPQVDAALEWANKFFLNFGPSSSLTKSQRAEVLSYAAILDGYNNGLVGPGHCE